MSCIYGNWEGECTLFEDSASDLGCDSNGICVCDGDPEPSNSCCNYESDYYCDACGADLNIEDCTCEDEE